MTEIEKQLLERIKNEKIKSLEIKEKVITVWTENDLFGKENYTFEFAESLLKKLSSQGKLD